MNTNPFIFMVQCVVCTMGSGPKSVEKKIQLWSYKGVNTLWISFFILSLVLSYKFITNMHRRSISESAFLMILLIGILIGIVDRIRTSGYFVYIWTFIGLLSIIVFSV